MSGDKACFTRAIDCGRALSALVARQFLHSKLIDLSRAGSASDSSQTAAPLDGHCRFDAGAVRRAVAGHDPGIDFTLARQSFEEPETHSAGSWQLGLGGQAEPVAVVAVLGASAC